MKCAVYLGKEKIEIRESEKPKVGKNDVLVKNIYSSICGTDVAVFTQGPNTGHKITVGQEFGHETVSRIVEIGENVTDFTIGERVYPYPLFVKKDFSRAGPLASRGSLPFYRNSSERRDSTLGARKSAFTAPSSRTIAREAT